ncbi:MAG: orotidine-5'-phosphate decarboxylase [Proteobacteria bacterium]|nr:orotidine-5'-phosphate decarboxylase [Pseudomonadota bacterium]
MPRRNGLAELLLAARAVELRAQPPFFTFASGLRSPIYTDNRLLISDPAARRQVAEAFVAAIEAQALRPTVVAGTATAGIPHATLVAERLGLPLVYVRGDAKGHGKGKRVEGRLAAGARVVLIEDLISTGGSSVSAAQALRDAGAEVVAVLAIFSYGMAAAAERFRASGLAQAALVAFDEVLQEAQARGQLAEAAVSSLLRWRDDPEHWQLEVPAAADAAEAAAASRDAGRTEALVVAADLEDRAALERLADAVAGSAGYYKLNAAFLAHGPALVAAVRRRGLEVFLDLKFHDIPNTAANYVSAAARLDVQLLTIHASGGPTMLRACVAAADRAAAAGLRRPRLLAVTALTSLPDAELAAIGIEDGRAAQVVRLARLAQACGVDGIVCSVAEAAAVRSACGAALLIVTPGVRLASGSANDHARVDTPSAAVAAGATHVVVGRPIYEASAAAAAAAAIAAELRQATAARPARTG